METDAHEANKRIKKLFACVAREFESDISSLSHLSSKKRKFETNRLQKDNLTTIHSFLKDQLGEL